MCRRAISIILTLSFFFQQTGFAQAAAVELNLAGYFARMGSSLAQESFRPLHLRYFSYDNLTNEFKVLLDKGDTFKQTPGHKDTTTQEQELQAQTKELLKYFLIGVTLPDDIFWVNLRPDSPEQIIDSLLAQTDVGKIMLETDLQLKKDTALYTSPQTPEGKEYWNRLYKKAEELYGNENVTIPTLTRPWIVPGEIIVRETKDEGRRTTEEWRGTQASPSAYIYKATLKVMLEEDYLKNQESSGRLNVRYPVDNFSQYQFKDSRSKALNEYSTQLIRELIIPKLTKEVNSSKRYAALRQVYYSLILSRWFKSRFADKKGLYPTKANPENLKGTVPGFTDFISLIDKQNLSNLTSKAPWDKTTYFNAYKKSFTEGEYDIKEPHYTPTGQVIRSYFSGGEALQLGAMGIEKNPVAGVINAAAAMSPIFENLPGTIPVKIPNAGLGPIQIGNFNTEDLSKTQRQASSPGEVREQITENRGQNSNGKTEGSSPAVSPQIVEKIMKILTNLKALKINFRDKSWPYDYIWQDKYTLETEELPRRIEGLMEYLYNLGYKEGVLAKKINLIKVFINQEIESVTECRERTIAKIIEHNELKTEKRIDSTNIIGRYDEILSLLNDLYASTSHLAQQTTQALIGNPAAEATAPKDGQAGSPPGDRQEASSAVTQPHSLKLFRKIYGIPENYRRMKIDTPIKIVSTKDAVKILDDIIQECVLSSGLFNAFKKIFPDADKEMKVRVLLETIQENFRWLIKYYNKKDELIQDLKYYERCKAALNILKDKMVKSGYPEADTTEALTSFVRQLIAQMMNRDEALKEIKKEYEKVGLSSQEFDYLLGQGVIQILWSTYSRKEGHVYYGVAFNIYEIHKLEDKIISSMLGINPYLTEIYPGAGLIYQNARNLYWRKFVRWNFNTEEARTDALEQELDALVQQGKLKEESKLKVAQLFLAQKSGDGEYYFSFEKTLLDFVIEASNSAEAPASERKEAGSPAMSSSAVAVLTETQQQEFINSLIQKLRGVVPEIPSEDAARYIFDWYYRKSEFSLLAPIYAEDVANVLSYVADHLSFTAPNEVIDVEAIVKERTEKLKMRLSGIRPKIESLAIQLLNILKINIVGRYDTEYKKKQLISIIKQIVDFINENEAYLASSSTVVSHPPALNLQSSAEVASPAVAPKDPGGISFRSQDMIIKYEPMGSLQGLNFKLPTLSYNDLQKMNLAFEAKQIKQMIASGMTPSGERIKEFLAACAQKKALSDYVGEVAVWLVEICRLDEQQARESTPELKEAIVILENIAA